MPARRPALVLGMTVFAAACSGREPTDVGVVSQGIVHGTASDSSQDAVVLISDPKDGFECTGTLIAPNLVLTARHCVSVLSSDSVGCDQNGNTVVGGQLGSDYPPANLDIYVGSTRATQVPKPTAHGARIFHDGATAICNHDLAVIELDQSLTGASVAALRLDAGPTMQDSFTVVGWGITEASVPPLTRLQRSGVGVLALGGTTYEGLPVPPNDFLMNESICDGDSGAAAFAKNTGAVVGVAATGTNNTTPSPSAPGAACVDAGFGVLNTFTQVAAFKGVIEQAFGAAGGQPVVEDAVPSAGGKSGGCRLGRDGSGVPARGSALAAAAAILLLAARRRRKVG